MNSSLEFAEEEVAFVEVAEEGFSNAVFLFEGRGAVVVAVEGEVAGVDFEIGCGLIGMVVFVDDALLGQLFDEKRVHLHGLQTLN